MKEAEGLELELNPMGWITGALELELITTGWSMEALELELRSVAGKTEAGVLELRSMGLENLVEPRVAVGKWESLLGHNEGSIGVLQTNRKF